MTLLGDPDFDPLRLRKSYYQNIKHVIQTYQHHKLRQELELVPLTKVGIKESNLMLRLFLIEAYNADNIVAVKNIIQHWSNYNPEEDARPIFVYVFQIEGIGDDVYRFYIKHDADLIFSDYIVALNNYAESEETQIACTRIHQAFGVQRINIYQGILGRLGREDNINHIIHRMIGNWALDAVESYAPIPEWIIPGISDPIPSHAELVELLDQQLTPADLNSVGEFDWSASGVILNPEQIQQIKEGLSQVAADQSEILIKGLHEYSFVNNEEMLKTLGPSRLTQGPALLDSHSKDPCLRWGGCRMLVCHEWENISDDGEPLTDDYTLIEWFTGGCQVCGRQIRHKHHALRMPMNKGGWLGCYCSFGCLRNDIKDSDDIRLEYIGILKMQLTRYGIYDRRWPEETTGPVVLAPLPELPSWLVTDADADEEPDFDLSEGDEEEGPAEEEQDEEVQVSTSIQPPPIFSTKDEFDQLFDDFGTDEVATQRILPDDSLDLDTDLGLSDVKVLGRE